MLTGAEQDNPGFVLQNTKLREENLALTERLRYLEQEMQHVGLQLQH